MITHDTMYAVGQIAGAIWPFDPIPVKILDMMLTRPVTGIGMAIEEHNRLRAKLSFKSRNRYDGLGKILEQRLAELIEKLPGDLKDPVGGVPIVQQGSFWTGYYQFRSAVSNEIEWGPEELERSGKLLYGDRWQSDLARALDVNDRRVREWAAGRVKIRAGVWADIAALIRQRNSDSSAHLAKFESALEPISNVDSTDRTDDSATDENGS